LKSRLLAISNHGFMVGGGEHSFLDLLFHMPSEWRPLAVVPERGELALRLEKRGIATSILPLPPIRPWFIGRVLYALNNYFTFFRRHFPSLVYANGSRAAFYGGLTARMLNIPLIWHCRIADRDPYLDFLISRLSAGIVTNSHATSKRFKPRFSQKIRVVYNGIDLQWLRGDVLNKPEFIGADWKVILHVARVSRWKRHDLALGAFERIAKVEPKAHLVCLGAKDRLDPGWWDQLQAMSTRCLFSERIHWIGQVEDIRPWLRSAFLLLLTSDNEPFGRVLVEAMACGLPVVATRCGGIPEIVREGLDGLLVAPGSTYEVSDAVVRLLNHDALRKRLSESGRKRAEEFSLENHVHLMVQVFEETLRFHSRRVTR
jgi:glycosyltransferase involved in cell wall biosynthesis